MIVSFSKNLDIVVTDFLKNQFLILMQEFVRIFSIATILQGMKLSKQYSRKLTMSGTLMSRCMFFPLTAA